MPSEVFYILTPPDQLPCLRSWDAIPAHPAYRLSSGLRLLRLRRGPAPAGGMMVLSGCTGELSGSPVLLCREIVQECALRGFRGVLLDLERSHPLLSQLVRLLDDALPRCGVSLFIPEEYAPLAPKARVLVPSAISGGSLAVRLARAVSGFGAERTVLAVTAEAEDFPLPAPDGCGTALTPEELNQLRQHACTTVHFSPALCAHYFLRRTGGDGLHLVLFDDTGSICQKMEVARAAGIRRFLLPWADISVDPGHFNLLPKHSGVLPEKK